MNWRLSFLVLFFLPMSVEAKTVFLQIRDFNFSPASIEIDQGDTVLWTNQGNMLHTVDGDGFESGSIDPGGTFEHTFSQSGTFDYDCGLHPSMTGEIIVVPVEESQALSQVAAPAEEEEEPSAPTADDLGSLSDFFETNNNTQPAATTTVESNTETHSSAHSQMSHSNMPHNAHLSTSGGHWIYGLGLAFLGVILFGFFFRRS